MGKEISAKVIEDYNDLKRNHGVDGQIIINNGSVEMVYVPELHGIRRFKELFENEGRMHTVSIEGNYFVSNEYGMYQGNEPVNLEPLMKYSARFGSGTGLQTELKHLAIKGGLISQDVYEKRRTRGD